MTFEIETIKTDSGEEIITVAIPESGPRLKVIQRPLHTIFLSASKYRAMEEEKGVAPTLVRISQDLGWKRAYETRQFSDDDAYFTRICGLYRTKYLMPEGKDQPIVTHELNWMLNHDIKAAKARKSFLDNLLSFETAAQDPQSAPLVYYKHMRYPRDIYRSRPSVMVCVTP